MDSINEKETVSSPVKRKKGITHPESYKRNVIKKARVCGEEYTDYKGNKKKARRTRSPCRCQRKCYAQFDEVDKAVIFDTLYNMSSKDEQDLHLQRMIHTENVKRHRPRKPGNNLKQICFKYHILLKDKKIEVCRDAFFRLYDITDKRVRRIRKCLLEGKSPKDMRGKTLSGNMIGIQELNKIHDHISSFPTKQGHYQDITYLNEQLSVTKMYNLFKELHPETKIKYSFYNKYFHENFNLRFGRPAQDTCNVCEEKGNRLKSKELNDNAKKVASAELIVHKRRAKKFYTALRESTSLSESNDHILGLVFDFMQNTDLPKIPVQQMYYLRQLTVNTFCIHNLKTGCSQFYLYHEGQANKGACEVASFLVHYIQENVQKSVSELHLFSDNCPGQNKNHTLARVLLSLTDTERFKKIKHFFPLRGHSYLPCDRKFSIIKRPISRCSRIYTLHQLRDLIVGAETRHINTVTLVDGSMIVDFDTWWPRVYKRNVNSMETAMCSYKEKEHFQISKYHYFHYSSDRKGVIQTSQFVHTVKDTEQNQGYFRNTFFLSKCSAQDVQLPRTSKYPTGIVPIKENKRKDIAEAVKYVPDEYKKFYEDILLSENSDSD